MKIGGSGANRRAGLHFFIDHPDSSNRDNNYMVYFRVDQNAVQIYKYINNQYNLMTNDYCDVNEDTWYNYKVEFDPETNTITAYQNNIQVSQWTDTEPLQIGDYLSLRTGNAIVEYDNIKVYVERNSDFYNFDVSQDTASLIHYQNQAADLPAFVIHSIAKDGFGNFSDDAEKYVNIDFTNPEFYGPVNDGTAEDIDSLYDDNFIAANWSAAFDTNDYIDEYFVAIGTQPGTDDLISWVSNGNSTTFDTSGVSLQFGQTYYASVYCSNNAGLVSDTVVSDGVVVTMPGGEPHAGFTFSDSLICVGDSIMFVSTSTYAAGYLWIFEGGTPYFSIEENPVVVYNNQGLFDVTLIVTNELGSDTLIYQNLINVEGKPVADFTAYPTEGTQPLEVSFNNASFNSYYYNWDFGDGTVSEDMNPVHTYNVVGSYDVTLVAGNNSCPNDTIVKTDYITVITDVGNEELTNMSVYPIPAENYLIIKSDNPNLNVIRLVSVSGKIVTLIKDFHYIKKIDISTLSSGIYVLEFYDYDEKILGSKKILKK